MQNTVKDRRVLKKGQHILVELKEAISEIKNLETDIAKYL